MSQRIGTMMASGISDIWAPFLSTIMPTAITPTVTTITYLNLISSTFHPYNSHTLLLLFPQFFHYCVSLSFLLILKLPSSYLVNLRFLLLMSALIINYINVNLSNIIHIIMLLLTKSKKTEALTSTKKE